jgi:hypothetical protein
MIVLAYMAAGLVVLFLLVSLAAVGFGKGMRSVVLPAPGRPTVKCSVGPVIRAS